jgi:hypothetical protein
MSKDKFSISTLFNVEFPATEKRKHHYLEKVNKVEEEHNEGSNQIYYSLRLSYFHFANVIIQSYFNFFNSG